MSGRDFSADHRRYFGQAALAMLALHDFAFLLIDHVTAGGALDDGGVAALRAECLRNLKNADAVGHTAEEWTEVLGGAVENVERLIDDAIRRGRRPQGLQQSGAVVGGAIVAGTPGAEPVWPG